MASSAQVIKNRRDAYRRCFTDAEGKLTPDGKTVFADLARFCRLYKSTMTVSQVQRQTDVPATFLAEGRREVILRILAHLHIDDGDLFRATQRAMTDD